MSAPLNVRGQLERALHKRHSLRAFKDNEAVRVFHGPGEGLSVLQEVAIDVFGRHAWVTFWEGTHTLLAKAARDGILEFLQAEKYESAVLLSRPQKSTPKPSEILFGNPPVEKFVIHEHGRKSLIQFRDVLHPGLFLDHLELRDWLQTNAREKSFLNTFAYTGSLSVAAGLGGAKSVTTLDLSKPTIDWARANWELNAIKDSESDFIFGDCFEWLPKLIKKGRRFDAVILDPPSFSRGPKGEFSTTKDLPALHELAIDLLYDGGWIITSINSGNISWARFENEIKKAFDAKGSRSTVIRKLKQHPTFPARGENAEYLKGFVLRVEK